eukprot:TRINITY_DN14369_c0_g1_i1.p1 TRINITY_DN14369_c0_g1~~TRINITY_DN14369_c0_g1_i1.p1  ORF type:complete len:149 (-),score=21.69 TRINITY_DN14369_c0_g1_i1:230-676(-)
MAAANPALDLTLISGSRKANDLIFTRNVKWDEKQRSISYASLTLGPDPEALRPVTHGTLTEKDREIAIRVTDKEYQEELNDLRSGSPVLVRAAIRRLRTHTVFEPRDVVEEIPIARNQKGKRTNARKSMASSASAPSLVAAGSKLAGK